jgi:hypothetical protein
MGEDVAAVLPEGANGLAFDPRGERRIRRLRRM